MTRDTDHALANTIPGDRVKLVPGDCEKCGPYKPMRVLDGIRQCGACGWVQEPER